MQISKNINNINYTIDFKTELITIILYLAKNQKNDYIFVNRNSNYCKKIDKYFEKYKEHECIKLFDTLFKNNFDYDKPYTFIYTLEGMPLY